MIPVSDPHQAPGDAVTFVLDLRVYELDATLRAAYRFIDAFYVDLHMEGPHKIEVRLCTKSGEVADERALAGEFHNELLHCVLRRSVLRETKGVREMILGRALFGALVDLDERSLGLIDPDGVRHEAPADSMTGYAEDAAGITRDWFE
jgi:His-Xaa-Ser system protein HxsD